MDPSLFNKHLQHIQTHIDSKKELILYIQERTGIALNYKALTLSKKEVTFHLSSALKQKMFQKNITAILKEKGFNMKP